MGATAFIETMDYSSLSNITQEKFEKNVEEAVSRVGSRSPAPSAASSLPSGSNVNLGAPLPRTPMHQRTASASADPHAPLTSGEEAASHLPTSPPLPPPPPLPVTGALNFADDTKAFLQRTGEAARVGFTNSLGKPIGALGKLLGEGLEGIRTPGGGSGSTSTGASPARVGSPSQVEQQLQQQQQQQQQGASGSGARSGIWGGLFGAEDPNDNAPPPQTPAPGQQRQGPFSSLMRGGGAAPTDPAAYSSGSTSNVAPQRRIGETPYAPPRQKPAHILTGAGAQQGGRPAPVRQESVDPFNSPDPATTTTPGMGASKGGTRGGGGASAAQSGRFAGPGPTTSRLQSRGYEGYGYEDEDDDHDTGRGGRGGGGSIGTPSDLDSDEEDERRAAAAGGAGRARSRLPDLGAFVPSFLTQQPQQQHQQPTSRAGGQQHYLTRGPNRGQPAFPSSSVGQPSSDDPDLSISSTQGGEDMSALSAEVDRRHREQVEASVETLKSVFPQMDEEVRRAVLEECGGDVGVAIDSE